MNNTISAGARILLDLIYRTETGRDAPACYRTIIGHRENQLQRPITDMTVAELLTAQKAWGRKWGSSAAGAPQIIRATMLTLVKRLGLSGNEKFSADLQDAMAIDLLRQRGWDAFLTGRNSITQFGNALCREWASFPALSPIKKGNKTVHRGKGYYDGDGLNKSLISPEKVEATLRLAREAERRPIEAPVAPEAPKPVPSPQPAPAPAPVAKRSLLQIIIDLFAKMFGR